MHNLNAIYTLVDIKTVRRHSIAGTPTSIAEICAMLCARKCHGAQSSVSLGDAERHTDYDAEWKISRAQSGKQRVFVFIVCVRGAESGRST